ncbi:MAG: LacI family DNA-binding transcriptional regulator [Candidatus Limiplasma sp.]|nr:LacI family DNA-binding transcriptional regulator [Candidatus Limiplasma sp.]
MKADTATVKDVARHAQVSLATVSRVINGADNVSPHIRQKVQDSIKALNYFPNNAARALVRRKADSIAILIRNLHSTFFSDLIHGMEDGGRAKNLNVLFCSMGKEQENRDRYIQFLTNGITDGIILYGPLFSDQPIIEHLHGVKFPFLLIENNFQSLPVHQILINNQDGARVAVEHLIELGHTKIVHFMGDPNRKINLDRFNGYLYTMHAHGLNMGEHYVRHIGQDSEAAYSIAREMMRLPSQERPTAIFCSDDKIAAQAIMGIMDAGFSVPENVSVLCFDRLTHYEDQYRGPDFTYVGQPLYEIGRDSIMYLTEILEGNAQEPIMKTYDTTLVLGGTTAPPERSAQ